MSPTDKFTPLAPAAPTGKDRSEFRVTVLRDTQLPATFQALTPPPTASHAAPASAPHSHEPQITLQRDGECITAIQIQCSCGRTIELGCTYAANPAKA